jgi:peroxiredoxin
VGVSFDSPSENLAWAEEENFPFELWTDDDKVLALTYGSVDSASSRTPGRVTVLLDVDGTWLLNYDPVNAITGPQDVLEDCQALFGGQ